MPDVIACDSALDGEQGVAVRRLPPWIRINLGMEGKYRQVSRQVVDRNLHTVCQSARCPNRNECWNAGTATFMILGNSCTRNCRFCGVPNGIPQSVDVSEPDRIAEAVAALSLQYVVITSVTRDDLSDGGASLFADTIGAIRRKTADCRVEVLVPDFMGSEEALLAVIDAKPDMLGHNIETVPSLYRAVRPQARYSTSLELLRKASERGVITKSGIMVGLGEMTNEISQVFRDLRMADCQFLTIGQYLRPGQKHLPVQRYYHPEDFDALQQEASTLGFRGVVAGPLVRSSYRAEQYGGRCSYK